MFSFSQLLLDPSHLSIHPTSLLFLEKKRHAHTQTNKNENQNKEAADKWDKNCQNKKSQNKPWSLACVDRLLLGIELPLSAGNTPSDTPLDKTDFPFPYRHHLQIASWVGVGICFYFPFSVLGHCLGLIFVGLVHVPIVSVKFICTSVLLYLESIAL